MPAMQSRVMMAGAAMAVISLLATWAAGQAVKSVSAEGIGVVLQGNVDIARDQALEDALRKAVEQAVGTLVESETLVRNAQLLSDQIYKRTTGYIRAYTILEERQEGQVIRVRVRATVDTGNLEQDLATLGLLYRRVKQPRIMVVIPETHIGLRPPDPAGETEIIRQLIQKGIRVVDQAQTRRIRESDQVRRALAGDREAARLIGLRHGAEVLIIGEAFSEGAMRGGPLGPMVSVRARLEARAIRTDTGEILAADGQFAAAVDIAEHMAGKKALAAAGSKWLEAALPVVLNRWTQEASGGSSVQLVVHGLSLRQLTQFEAVLKTHIRGVKDIQRRSFERNIAVLEVDVAATGQALADELSHRALGGFDVEVITFSPHRLDLRIRPRQ